ncbi:ATP-binding cassette domain-containing protein [Pseudobacteroides cellulosolvens]|uniref:ABC transporter ATP-binding protein n=1 Tax=Pseudobacteroides cellulosolvens ATCC 35603 = DSM 2933 TaxID=398512 RepID=A0A0L6JQP7_9FIRM|nr:ATP-binding cassette domain-containing protein [Pseudobacteroides cellulosolvens]KNY28015.1 cobalt ABC transporter, ATPase subunit [Pseudobacteroides cellulosolvens ATCC 35603 = DSM 2933]
MTDNILETKELLFVYTDKTKALENVNIKIKRSQTTAILGGNGAGKSTLFLCFNGILKPVGGTILYNGQPLDYSHNGLKHLRRKVGIVFQDPDNQLFSASVYKDISFGLMNMKLEEKDIRQKVDIAMDRTGISHLKDRPTHSLSFGQKKRVAIAGVLAMEPEVLILDEPTAGLDPCGVSEIMKLLKNAQKELGITCVLSTHDIDIVPLYCDYTYVLSNGNVKVEGTTDQVFSNKDALRKMNLRLPRVGHLIEILNNKDGFEFSENDETAVTIAKARRAIINWRDRNGK